MHKRWPDLGIVMMGPEDRAHIREAIRVDVKERDGADRVVEDWHLDHLVENMHQGQLFSAILRAAGRPWKEPLSRGVGDPHGASGRGGTSAS
jgi:hypothetical protein